MWGEPRVAAECTGTEREFGRCARPHRAARPDRARRARPRRRLRHSPARPADERLADRNPRSRLAVLAETVRRVGGPAHDPMPAGRDRPSGQARPRRVHRVRRTGRRRWRSGPGHRRCARHPTFLPGGEAARPWDAATGALVRRPRRRRCSGPRRVGHLSDEPDVTWRVNGLAAKEGIEPSGRSEQPPARRDRLGGRVTPPVRPHHRACGSVHGGSSAPLQIPELSQKVQESPHRKQAIVHGRMHVRGPRVPPGARPVAVALRARAASSPFKAVRRFSLRSTSSSNVWVCGPIGSVLAGAV